MRYSIWMGSPREHGNTNALLLAFMDEIFRLGGEFGLRIPTCKNCKPVCLF